MHVGLGYRRPMSVWMSDRSYPNPARPLWKRLHRWWHSRTG